MTRLLYLECTAGISGDMAAAALLDAGASEEVVRRALDSLDVEGFAVEINRVVKSGLDVCDFAVVLDAAHENHDHDMAYLHGREREDGREREEGGDREGSCVGGDGYGYGLDGERECGGGRGHGHGHGRGHSHDGAEGAGHHRGPREIEAIIDGATMTEEAKATARRIFELVAQAEARAHGVPLGDVHFHEVGAVDSIADIVAIAAAVDDLNVDGVVVTDLPCGRGTVRCQHGLIPVPAPATAFIAEACGLPLTPSTVEGELVTPTGAAVAGALRTQGALPERFTIQRIGMGAGKRAYDTSGILRAMIVEPLV
ncbi:nickel insertion protein [uncultured Adlercreutzia sp.]|uniref:nickel insertion protein n=1 Tax=uncultured Adlercreutzia sp. TaxID=875803 RepID=UPI0025A4E85C|nr:nickel insertion protein [uncultured Adlercreutzia sp.]